MHPKVQELADHFGVKLSPRTCNSKYDDKKEAYTNEDHLFDGCTIAMYSKYGEMSEHDLIHEIAHYVVALPEQKDLPEYGLGYTASNGMAYVDQVVDIEEAEIQEHMVQFLCVKWGKAYQLNCKMSETLYYSSKEEYTYIVIDDSWDQYLEYKNQYRPLFEGHFTEEEVHRLPHLKSQSEEDQRNFNERRWKALIRLSEMGWLDKLPL